MNVTDVKDATLGEIRFRQRQLARKTQRLRRMTAVYGVYRDAGHNKLQSWAAAEREVKAVEWIENRRRADRFLFRLEVERDLQNLELLT